MNIIHISAECYPVAKVGGLADVVGALPKYLAQQHNNVAVVVPKYETKFTNSHSFETVFSGKVYLGNALANFTIEKETEDVLGFQLYLINMPGVFRNQVYGYHDDTERFMLFQKAFLYWLTHQNIVPDVIHCHDHHTALIPFMIQFCDVFFALKQTPTVLTIHNGQYQGWFGFDKLYYFPKFDLAKAHFLEWGNSINPLAAGIKCAWRVTTVSPEYLNEITYNANGLENLVSFERKKSIGILNGIDSDVWNTETDTYINQHYSLKNFKQGKQKNKKEVCNIFNFNSDKPLFIFIGRLVYEKSADLLPQFCVEILTELSQDINILILGSGDPHIENALENIKQYFKGSYDYYKGYNEPLAHKMYAAADFLLMPSRVEPCGLNQMYALRYGTIPIVRKTGGLKDTIQDIGDNGVGICHDQASVWDMKYSVYRGLELYKNKKLFNEVITRAMQRNHSWNSVAQEYIDVYKSL